MEASVSQSADGAEPQSSGPDLSPLMDRMGELVQSTQQFNQRLDQFEQRLPAEQVAEEPDPFDGWDAEGLMDVSGQMDPQAAQQALQDLVQRGVQSQLAQVVEPLQQQLADLRTSWDAASLQQTYPDLAKPDVAEKTVSQASEYAQQIATSPEHARELVRNPGFIKLVYEAMQAGERAAGEVPAADGIAELEAAGGASPGGGDGPSLAEELLAERKQAGIWF